MKDASYAPLPASEVTLYFVIWIGGVFYSVYCVFLASDTFGKLHVDELEPGWLIIGTKKDVADYEWRMWLPFLYELVPWIFLHHIVAEILRWKANQVILRLWYVLVSSLFILHYCGWIALVAMISTPLFLYNTSKQGGRYFCWAASILCLICPIVLPDDLMTEKQQMTLYVCFAWMQLRCLSYCMDWINDEPWSSNTQYDSSIQELRLLSYAFYLPLMFLGPFVSCSDFEKGLNMMPDYGNWQNLKSRLIRLVLNCARFLGWMALTEFCLHFIFCNAIQHHHEALPYLDAWTLHGLAYCIGQFFLNKYVVVYGLMGTLAGFDGICAPPIPRCIAHISKYSDMWRHFDRGFYNFLRRYIYDPLVESKKRKHHVFFTTVSFAFVFIWHGLSMNIFVWSICNFFGVLCESFGHEVTKLQSYQLYESKLSPQNIRRWRALATSPLFIMSALTMFFFLGGMEVGLVFVLQVLYGSAIRNIVLLLFAYCMCQVSIEIKIFKAQKKRKFQRCTLNN